MKNSPDLSIVVLGYKAGRSLYGFIKRLTEILEEQTGGDFQIVLVGNYNRGDLTDETPQVARDIVAQDSRIKAVVKVKEGMMGWDMRSGLEAATGRFLAVIDGDGQMPVGDLVRVYKKILESNADLAKTYRVTRGDGFKRRAISLMYNLLFKILFPGLKSKDINSKPKIIRREAFEKLRLTSSDWFIDAEIMIQARRLRLKIAEISTDFLGLDGRKSFVSLGAIFEFLKNLLLYRLKEFKE